MSSTFSERGPGPVRRFPWRAAPWMLLALAATVSGARAQFDQSPDAAGKSDGRMKGIEDGRDLGRSQQLLKSYIQAFSESLKELKAAERVSAVANQARAAGLRAGRAAALEEARALGAEDARASWRTHLESRPRVASAMSPAEAPSNAESDACDEAEQHTLTFPSGRTLTVNSKDLETIPFPLTQPFERPYPPLDKLRQRARDNGSSAAGVSDWVTDYQRAFDAEYFDVFGDQRDGTPRAMRERFAEMGRIAGQTEGLRREACAAWTPAWQDGWTEGRRDAWDEGHALGWEEMDRFHAESAVVLFESAEILNAEGTGLLEPAGEAELHVTYVNAGGLPVNRSAGRFQLIRGGKSEGRLAGDLPSGSRRTEVLPLGTLDPKAPTGSSAVVLLKGLGGARETVVARLGRPVLIDALAGRLEVRGGRLVSVANVTLKAVGPHDGPLSLNAGELSQDMGTLAAGRTKQVELVGSTELPSALQTAFLGTVELRGDDGQPWQKVSWQETVPMGRAVELVAALAEPSSGAEGIAARLMAEYDRAAETEEELSELTAFARAFSRLPQGEAKSQLDSQVNEAIRARATAKNSPRSLRKAVKQILGS